jgi:hypothetical protein
MLYLTLLGLLLIQTTPPGQNPPNPPGQQQPPATGQQPVTNVPNQTMPGSMTNPMVDGIYSILAYEKFGQVLPGFANTKVAIRNNILTFAGDGKFPGKMLQLTFGPNNTVTITPLDGRDRTPQPPVNQAGNNTQPPIIPPVGGAIPGAGGSVSPFNPPASGGASGNAAPGSGEKNSKIIASPPGGPVPGNPKGDSPVPRNGGTTPGTGQRMPPIIASPPGGPVPGNPNGDSPIPQSGQDRNPNSESGVYVLSTEFFSISVIGRGYHPVGRDDGSSPPVNDRGDGTNPPLNGKGNEQSKILPPNTPIPRNPNPPGPGVPSQAVLVLKRVSN